MSKCGQRASFNNFGVEDDCGLIALNSQLSTLNNQRSTSAHHKPVTMHELNAVEAGVSPAILVVAAVYDRRSLPSREASMRYETILCVRILDTTQIRRLIGFSFAVDLTIQRFHGAP
jgi:hypothetical protein